MEDVAIKASFLIYIPDFAKVSAHMYINTTISIQWSISEYASNFLGNKHKHVT